MMKPYSRHGLSHEKRIFNYRLFCATGIVENAFGILANRFQCILNWNHAATSRYSQICRCSRICLHNLMRTRYPGLQNALLDQEDNEHRPVPGAWRNDALVLADMTQVHQGNRDTVDAKRQCICLTHYLTSPARAIEWQNEMI